MSNKVLVVHRDDFRRIGSELFGDDPRKWRFRCVRCGHEQSHEDATTRNPSIGDTSSWIFFSCEGRRTRGVGCDWTLGGLFQVHTLEVFDQGRLVPSFEFAHARARELLEAAAKAFAIPQHPTTEARTWAEHTWPDWIPEAVRGDIMKFWRGLGPREWLTNARNNGAPVLGVRVSLKPLDGNETLTGRYVHCWNNIGRLVLDDSSVAWVSF